MKNLNPKKISLILSVLVLVLWLLYGVAVIVRQSLTMTDFIVTWVGLVLMSTGNMLLSIMDYKEDK